VHQRYRQTTVKTDDRHTDGCHVRVKNDTLQRVPSWCENNSERSSLD